MRGKAFVETCSLQTVKGNIRVVPPSDSIFRSRLESELVVTVSMLILSVYKKKILDREIALHFIESERPVSIFGIKRCAVWLFRLHVNSGGRSIFRRRLKTLVLVGVIQRHRLHIRQRIFAQVHLSILSIRYPYSVEIYAYMLRTKRTDIYRLQASQPSIVLYLNAREIFQGICNRISGKIMKILARQSLTGSKIMRTLTHTNHV